MKVARVFPTKTSMCPDDPDVYFGLPDLFTPKYDEVHISCQFTWDVSKAKIWAELWKYHGKTKLGGVAIDGESDQPFRAGVYLKKGITITSRGCPNSCSFCTVRSGLIEFDNFPEGNIIQDNNLLACSRGHLTKVFKMLKTQKHINFSGGFESARVTDEIVEELRGLRIYQIWLAYDHPNAERSLNQAVNRLSKYFKRDKIRCYVLIGYEGDTLERAENRLRKAWEIGTLPFAMRYRTPDPSWNGTYLFKERSWNLLARQWTRPAIIKSLNRLAP